MPIDDNKPKIPRKREKTEKKLAQLIRTSMARMLIIELIIRNWKGVTYLLEGVVVLLVVGHDGEDWRKRVAVGRGRRWGSGYEDEIDPCSFSSRHFPQSQSPS